MTLSCINVALAGIRSQGNWTSNPTAVWTSDNGPGIVEKRKTNH